MTAVKRVRFTYLLQSDRTLLEQWASVLYDFCLKDALGVYIVGSCLRTKGYRDVDIRMMLTDADYETLGDVMDIHLLNTFVSLWGQKVTGLPIDFQFQSMTEGNSLVDKTSRHPIGKRS